MAKVRSPNYPGLDLGAALEVVRPALKAENRNKMSRAVLAGHMGYGSLNGRALGRIGAVRAFGLIDGSGDELRISDDAVTALMSPDKATIIYKDALERLALKPTLFQDIKKQFPTTLPSEQNLAFWLVQQGFTQEAAGKAAKNYLATMRLVYDGAPAYNPPPEPDNNGQEDADSDPPPPPPPHGNKVKVMAGERELTKGILAKDASFRLIVTGNIGVKEIERLIKKLEIDKEILADQDDENEEAAN